jgi:hypothetical protein
MPQSMLKINICMISCIRGVILTGADDPDFSVTLRNVGKFDMPRPRSDFDGKFGGHGPRSLQN